MLGHLVIFLSHRNISQHSSTHIGITFLLSIPVTIFSFHLLCFAMSRMEEEEVVVVVSDSMVGLDHARPEMQPLPRAAYSVPTVQTGTWRWVNVPAVKGMRLVSRTLKYYLACCFVKQFGELSEGRVGIRIMLSMDTCWSVGLGMGGVGRRAPK